MKVKSTDKLQSKEPGAGNAEGLQVVPGVGGLKKQSPGVRLWRALISAPHHTLHPQTASQKSIQGSGVKYLSCQLKDLNLIP